MKTSYFLAICLVLLSVFHAAAQTTGGPPKVLLIVREDIKTGMMGPHSIEANNVVRIWAKAKSPYNRLAMVPLAGNENEVTYLWGFDSLATLEKSNKDLDTIATVTFKNDFDKVRPPGDDYHSSQRDSIAVLREDLGYGGPVEIAQMRYMRVQTIRVKPGQARDFEDGRKILNAAHQKSKIDEAMAVYQVLGGAQSGTYIVLIPWKSLDGMAAIPHGKAYWDAMGSDNRDKLEKIISDSVAFDAVDIYAFNPQLSYASERMIAVDPGFWALKPITGPAQTTGAKRKATAKKN